MVGHEGRNEIIAVVVALAAVEGESNAGIGLRLNLREGYDHSYYFISTFMADHLRWHSERLA